MIWLPYIFKSARISYSSVLIWVISLTVSDNWTIEITEKIYRNGPNGVGYNLSRIRTSAY